MGRFESQGRVLMGPYQNIREVLAPEYRKLPPQQIEALLESANIVAEDLEGFLDDLKKIGQGVVGALPSILPVAGTALGTAFAGPAGAALGGAAGQALGAALGPSPPRPAPTPSIQGPQPSSPQVQGPAAAAGQVLKSMFDPAVLQALIAMLLRQVGLPTRESIPVGPAKTLVPLGAFTNMVRELADRASTEHATTIATNGETIPRYLLDYAGEVQGDPAIAESRARILFEMLREADEEQSEPYREDSPSLSDQFYDELELVELYADYEFQGIGN